MPDRDARARPARRASARLRQGRRDPAASSAIARSSPTARTATGCPPGHAAASVGRRATRSQRCLRGFRDGVAGRACPRRSRIVPATRRAVRHRPTTDPTGFLAAGGRALIVAPGSPRMYLEHFQLKELPFRLSPDPAFLYPSPIHSRAKAYMESTIWFTDGFVIITGEIGSGKTTLIETFLQGDRQGRRRRAAQPDAGVADRVPADAAGAVRVQPVQDEARPS